MIRQTVLYAGYCTISEALLVPDGRRRGVSVPSLVALLDHPTHGLILFDTGYSPRFFSATAAWGHRPYRWLTPVTVQPADSVASQLAARGMSAADVRVIILSHFHADHLCGLLDFPNATFIYAAEAYSAVRGRRGWAATRLAYLPDLMPDDFEARSQPLTQGDTQPLPAEFEPFTTGVDLLGDQSLWAVSLPGHAIGHIGLIVPNTDNGPTFFVADACWHSHEIRDPKRPHWLPRQILDSPAAYLQTLVKLNQFSQAHPAYALIPSHCREMGFQNKKVGGRTAKPCDS